MQIKQGTVVVVPVRLMRKSDGEGLGGITHTNVSVYQSKAGAAPAYRALAADEWSEASTVNMPGIYWLKIRAADSDTPGFLVFSVTHPSAVVFTGLIEVQAALAEDAKASADAAKTSADAAVVAAVAAETAALDAKSAAEAGGSGGTTVFFMG